MKNQFKPNLYKKLTFSAHFIQHFLKKNFSTTLKARKKLNDSSIYSTDSHAIRIANEQMKKAHSTWAPLEHSIDFRLIVFRFYNILLITKTRLLV